MKLASDKRGKPEAPPPLRNITAAIEQQFGQIEHWPLGKILAYEKNPRKHPERQMTALTASVSEFGQVMPLLVSETGELICGHARLEALRRLGVDSAAVLVARCWSEAQIKAYRLADNRLAELGAWDLNLVAGELSDIIELGFKPIEVIGWSTGDMDKIFDWSAAPEPENPDVVPEPPVEPVSRTGDLWLLGKHRLYNASSLDAASWSLLMDGGKADLCLSDGPYNVPVNGHVSGSGRHDAFAMASGEMSPAQFTAFNADWLGAVKPHLRDGALVMAFMDHHHLFELMSAAREVGLKHMNLCVWAKTNAGMGSLYRSQHELVLVLKHGTAKHTNCIELGRHGRHRTNVWTAAGANVFGATRDADLAAHPTVKPQEILTEAIRDVTRQGELVVDAFSGSGSTILACERTKRVGYAIEIEPRYIDVAIHRWQALTGKSALLEGTGQTFADVARERLNH